jgi:hypothetical protein
MNRKIALTLAAAVAAATGSLAIAQVTVDGTITTSEYGPAKALQGTATGFGNNVSELDGAYSAYNATSGALNLGITGNLEGNGNGFVLFLDSRAGGGIANTQGGGFNQFGSISGRYSDDWGTDKDGGTGVDPTPGGGSIVNAGFTALDLMRRLHDAS